MARNLSNLSNSGNFSIPGKSWDDAMAARVILVMEEVCLAATVVGTAHKLRLACLADSQQVTWVILEFQ